MTGKSDEQLIRQWARYRRILRWMMMATALPVMVAGVLIIRHERLESAKYYIILALIMAFVMLACSAKLALNSFRRM